MHYQIINSHPGPAAAGRHFLQQISVSRKGRPYPGTVVGFREPVVPKLIVLPMGTDEQRPFQVQLQIGNGHGIFPGKFGSCKVLLHRCQVGCYLNPAHVIESFAD